MSATVYSTSKFGLASEATATGIQAANITFAGSSETALSANHVGQDVGVAIYNESIEASIDGVLAVKGAGFVVGLADLVTLANTAADSLTVTTNILKVTPNANASFIITAASLKRTNNGFETGDMTAIYKPGVATNAVSTAS